MLPILAGYYWLALLQKNQVWVAGFVAGAIGSDKLQPFGNVAYGVTKATIPLLPYLLVSLEPWLVVSLAGGVDSLSS